MPTPPLPIELTELIISFVRHAQMSPKQRNEFLSSASRVNSTWTELLARNVCIDSEASLESFFRRINHSSSSSPHVPVVTVERPISFGNLSLVKLFGRMATDPRLRAGQKPTKAVDYGRCCRSITFEIDTSIGGPQCRRLDAGQWQSTEVYQTFPMSALLDCALEHIDVHSDLLPNLRRLCIEYLDSPAPIWSNIFDDVFRRNLFALTPQIEHLEIRYPRAARAVRESLAGRRQKAFNWVAKDIRRLTLIGATKGVILDLKRVCPNVRVWVLNGVTVR
ncbi:hypothetical protein MIND_00309500 [Mycena indigotica]|uniref:Uncharacterized protein n=1 Tax=Mycena indigotica TaxID=2126181 RepID=A0A8H6T3T6_9AGAR|nr:uncharacterized protein MIND_00309500 [Mycena indigotica]KAF7309387.1 hypothetical protein MIND_00309500 [Mycena indigotica]